MYFFFFKQKTAYEMRISDWSSDVCSSDLHWNLGAGWYRSPGPRNFFDVKRAQTFWSELRTREQLDAYIAKNCPKGGPYDAWKQDYNDDHAKAIGVVKSDPNATKIMACHDLQVAIYVWRNLYVKIVKVPDAVRVRFNNAADGDRKSTLLNSSH